MRDGALQAGPWVLRAALVAIPLAYLPGIYQVAALPKLLALLAAALALALCCFAARRLWLSRRSPFVLPLLLYLLVTALQALRAVNPSEGLLMLAMQVGFGAVCVGAACVVAPGQEVSLLRFSAAAGLGVSLMGLLEHLGVPWAMLHSAGRPSATFGFRNIAAMYLAVNLPLSAVLVFRRRRWDWALGVAAVGSMVAFLMVTRTRGAWLGLCCALAVGIAVALWRKAEDGRPLAALLWGRLTLLRRASVVIALGFALVLGALPARFTDRSIHRLDEKKAGIGATVASMVRPGADRGRLQVWGHTLEMIRAYPVAGVGLENWSVFFPLYDGGDLLGLEVAPQRPHNDFLWIWAELGPAGLLAYLWLLWSVGVQVIRKMGAGEDSERMLALFLGMGMLALLGHSLFSFPREQAGPSALFWIALGLAGRSGGGSGDRFRKVGWGTRGCAAVGAAAALAGMWLCVEAIRFDRHFGRALVAQADGAAEAQAAAAGRALAHGVFDHRVFLMLGDAKARLGAHEEAVATYRTYRTYQPYLPAVYNNLGSAHDAAGALEEAEAAYRRGLEIHPGEAVLVNNLATVYKKQGRAAQALELYRSLRPGGKSAKVYHNLGLIYAEEEAFDKALSAYQEALRLDPEMVEVIYSLAGLYLLMEDYAASAAAYEAFLEQWTGNPAYVRRANARLVQIYPILGGGHIARGELSRAKEVYHRLEALGGATAEVYNNLAIIYRREGNRAASRTACGKALAADPEFAQAYFTLAGLLDEAGDREEALEAYGAFLTRWPKDDRFAGQARRRMDVLSRGR